MSRAVARWSPGRAARAHIYLGTAAAHLGKPEEAAEHGKRALTLGRDYGPCNEPVRSTPPS